MIAPRETIKKNAAKWERGKWTVHTVSVLMNAQITCRPLVGTGTMLLSRKVTGSIPDEVTGFFNWPNSCSRAMALGSTQPLTEMSARNLSGLKSDSSVRLATSPPSVRWLPTSRLFGTPRSVQNSYVARNACGNYVKDYMDYNFSICLIKKNCTI
jgi:hypothetical protein